MAKFNNRKHLIDKYILERDVDTLHGERYNGLMGVI